MKERHVTFKGQEMMLLLKGAKTQFRRVVNPQPYHSTIDDTIDHWRWKGLPRNPFPDELLAYCPYGKPGDRLWVKEKHAIWERGAVNEQGIVLPAERGVYYMAGADEGTLRHAGRWTSASRMPRWASRITLEVVSVRVQRLQDISEEDAMAEGCDGDCQIGYLPAYQKGPCSYHFAQFWQCVLGNGSWNSNPWVWAVQFKLTDR